MKHKYAYIPFGSGPRICIGYHFAIYEMLVILVITLQRFSLKLVNKQEGFECSLTLWAKGGIAVFLERIK